MFAGMNPGQARRSLRILVLLALSLGAGALSSAGEPANSHLDGLVVAAGDCPESRRVAPKAPAKPRPGTEAPRDRPPSSLPCCKGADCTCSGPPALAAMPPDAARRRAAHPA
jgi:hypothetical protein